MPNLTPILNSTKIALEKQASDKFGAAVEDFSRGTLGPAISGALGIPNPAATQQGSRNDGSWYSSSYAAALAGATSYRPKLKFLFKVEFIFTPEAQNAFPSVFRNSTTQDFTFMVKAVDRPKIDFEYEDDINMYNFRTKVLKKIRHRELTITFMDDVGNRVLSFFRALMMIHSPITRRQLLRENSKTQAGRVAPPDANSISTANGMMFSPTAGASLNDNAIRGTLDSTVGNIIQTIRVKQMYVDPSADLGGASKEVIFDFLNARLVSFDLDDLSHETSDANIMTMQFDYDWMEIVQVGSLDKADSPVYNITVPGVHGAPTDTSPSGRASSTSAGGGGDNPFANIITNQLGRAAQSLTSEAVNRAVSSIAGGGRFAGLIGAQISPILGGLVGAGSRSLASGVTGSLVNQGTAIFGSVKNLITGPSTSAVSTRSVMDSAAGGPSPVVAVITASSDEESGT